ncbi:MAG: hypothetical protein M1338_04330, partial [Patescibacteria group bacterium]|nr:hypothetical protein [Patescibacteria group bacterium]
QNKNRLYPVVPVLTKSVESLTTGEKKNYQEQYLNYVGEYNTKQSQEISYINQKFAANSLRTSERTQSKEKYYQDLGKNNLVNAQANLDKFFAGKNVAGNTLYSLKTEIENNTQSILTNRNQQEDYIEKNSVGNDKQTELADLTRKFNNNIQELENKYSQKTGNTEEVTKIINTQITKSAQKPSPAVESKGFLQKTWDKLKNFMKIGKAGAQDKSLEVEINNPADEKLVSYQAGNNLKFSVKGLKNSEYYEVYLDKQFLAQGKKITNDFSFEVTIPQEAKTGNHKIVFIGNVSGEQTEKNIDIIASAANLSIYYPIGLGLLMAILAIILIFRYKKQAS